MKESPKPEFDRYARTYTDLHRDSICASGEDPDYFSSYKAKYMAGHFNQNNIVQPQTILDFGCGIGNTISHLCEEFPSTRLHGVDLSGESIRLATEAHASEATFRTIVGSRIPYEDKAFDVVVAACVFHHIPPIERAHWMSEIKRVLKPRGYAFIFEHNMLNPLTVKAVRDCPFDEDAILLARSELQNLMHAHHFKEVKSRYIVFFPHFLRLLRPMEPLLGWVPLGAQYVVHGISP